MWGVFCIKVWVKTHPTNHSLERVQKWNVETTCLINTIKYAKHDGLVPPDHCWSSGISTTSQPSCCDLWMDRVRIWPEQHGSLDPSWLYAGADGAVAFHFCTLWVFQYPLSIIISISISRPFPILVWPPSDGYLQQNEVHKARLNSTKRFLEDGAKFTVWKCPASTVTWSQCKSASAAAAWSFHVNVDRDLSEAAPTRHYQSFGCSSQCAR